MAVCETAVGCTNQVSAGAACVREGERLPSFLPGRPERHNPIQEFASKEKAPSSTPVQGGGAVVSGA